MKNAYLELQCPENYNLEMTCHIHGWKNLAPFIWNQYDCLLSFACYLGTCSIDVQIRQEQDLIEAEIQSFGTLTKSDTEQIIAIIKRCLGLDINTNRLLDRAKNIGPEYVKLVQKGAGRVLRAPSLWEDAAKTLFTTNCTWALTKHMCDAACSEKFSQPTPNSRYPFPKPEIITDLSSDEIEKLMPIGYRSKYFIDLAKQFLKTPDLSAIEKNGYDFQSAYKIVNVLKGFGPYASSHLMVLCGYYDQIPIDTVVIAYLKRNYRFRKAETFINRHYKKWQEYKWWGLKLEKILKRENWLGN
jgi:3-methyladenine DNA glycosylase/8-oxoguanine DNA glycosylase